METDKPKLWSFDQNGDMFALVTTDNRLKIWETKVNGGTLKSEYVSPQHLVESITCLAWGQIASDDMKAQQDGSKRKRKQGKSESIKLVAMGLKTGDISIFSVNHGKVVYNLKGSHNKRVSSFVFSSTGLKGYSCDDEKVVEWDIPSEKEIKKIISDKGCSHVAVLIDDKTIISAGNSIKKVDIKSKEVKKEWSGHTTEIQQMVLSPNSTHLVSFATEDRFINIWSLPEDQNNQTASVLNVESNPLCIDSAESGNSQGQFYFLTLTDDDVINVWEQPIKSDSKNKKKSKPVKPESQVYFHDEENKKIGLIGGRFCTVSNRVVIIAARGSSSKPIFEQIDFTDDKGELIPEIKLQRESQNGLLIQQQKQEKTKKSKQDVTILGAADISLPAPKMTATTIEGMQGPTLEEKMKDLSVIEERSDKSIPKAGSLQQMLIQALHTDDSVLLEKCLMVSSPTVIRRTIQRLPPPYVIPFLTQIIARFQKKPNRGAYLAIWIREVLMNHTAYLTTVPNLLTKLGPLYQTVDHRLGVFKRLLRLSGRLEMVMSQVSLRNSENEATTYDALNTYDEENENVSEEDVMEEFSPASQRKFDDSDEDLSMNEIEEDEDDEDLDSDDGEEEDDDDDQQDDDEDGAENHIDSDDE